MTTLSIPDDCLPIVARGIASELIDAANAIEYHGDDIMIRQDINVLRANFARVYNLAGMPQFAANQYIVHAFRHIAPTQAKYVKGWRV